MFNSSKGQDLRKIINACLQFDRIANATKQIGQESAINARRVKAGGPLLKEGLISLVEGHLPQESDQS
jgi:hypothetical protein